MIWFIFLLLIFGLLALDLGVFHRSNETISLKESLKWTGIWVLISILFGGVVYWMYRDNIFNINTKNADPLIVLIDYYTGYVIEKSLSLDNIFIIALIFKFFKIQNKYQHNILFWGIIGAVFFRLGMILLGATFVEKFEYTMYIFGAILLFSAFKMIKESEEGEDFEKNIGVRLLSKIYKVDWTIHNGRYFDRQNGKLVATSMMAALVVVEFSDILFAVDSIPAIFSVTTDSFIVFTSNIFAILGLRSLYFFLSGMLDKFKYMKYSLIFILMFIGFKMLFHQFIDPPAFVSLVIILVALLLGILSSATEMKRNNKRENQN